ncbi:MAG: hypothetical protein HY782_01875 [Chloroflexi bacterium]|nr:hypothetical protein [Chloroflexota bacterium]
MPEKAKQTPETGNELENSGTLFPLEEVGPAIPEEKLKEYDRIIEKVFHKLREANPNAGSLAFTLKDVKQTAIELGLVQENPPDVAYTYRTGRSALPKSILTHGDWAITGAGKGKYEFMHLNRSPYVIIPEDLKIIRVLDATPQIVLKYQGKDEQSILARIRYNRLIDTFTSLTTYHLQAHLRTSIKGLGQVEMDDLYIGINTDGDGFILPVEAKSEAPRDLLGVVQITQMVRFARKAFPGLKVRPIGVKLMKGTFVFLEFNDTDDVNLVATETYKRYELYRER